MHFFYDIFTFLLTFKDNNKLLHRKYQQKLCIMDFMSNLLDTMYENNGEKLAWNLGKITNVKYLLCQSKNPNIFGLTFLE